MTVQTPTAQPVFGGLERITLPGPQNADATSTDVAVAEAEAWTAIEIDNFYTGPSVFDAQAVAGFRAMMAAPLPDPLPPAFPVDE